MSFHPEKYDGFDTASICLLCGCDTYTEIKDLGYREAINGTYKLTEIECDGCGKHYIKVDLVIEEDIGKISADCFYNGVMDRPSASRVSSRKLTKRR